MADRRGEYDARAGNRREITLRSTRAGDYLTFVGLAASRGIPARALRRYAPRVNLARALTVEPEVLLLDEPYVRWTPRTREIVQSELLRVGRNEEDRGTSPLDRRSRVPVRRVLVSAVPAAAEGSGLIDLPRSTGARRSSTRPNSVRY